MHFSQSPSPAGIRAIADATHGSFWLDSPHRPDATEPLREAITADLLVIGAGYSGLWAALRAKEDDPGRDVVVVDSGTAGWAASGRNGGFCSASLTHGFGNGLERFEPELSTLIDLGMANLNGIEATLSRYGIDAEFERTGALDVATQPHQAADLRELVDLAAPYGHKVSYLEADEVQAMVHSKSYTGGLLDRDGCAMVNPAKLAWGLRAACLSLGVRLFENSEVTGIDRAGAALVAKTAHGQIRTPQIALMTNAFPPLLRRLKSYIVPVYDYVLVSEPLTAEQRAAIGWQGREGIGDAGNQFHYYRQTADHRILWGGYDAVYKWNNGFGPHLDNDAECEARLATHFFETFPQLEGLRFTHTWGGAIDTCSRFTAFWGTAYDGRLAYAVGYTGLGVGSTRFGAEVVLDLLGGRDTERTRLDMVKSKPLPFPPEPARSLGIAWTTKSLAAADRDGGRRNLWLRSLDRLGLGFDS